MSDELNEMSVVSRAGKGSTDLRPVVYASKLSQATGLIIGRKKALGRDAI